MPFRARNGRGGTDDPAADAGQTQLRVWDAQLAYHVDHIAHGSFRWLGFPADAHAHSQFPTSSPALIGVCSPEPGRFLRGPNRGPGRTCADGEEALDQQPVLADLGLPATRRS